MQTEIAVLRFGLGAKPGELAAAKGDPQAWLRHQIQGAVPIESNQVLAPSDQILTAFLDARAERKQLKSSAAADDGEAAKQAVKPLREIYLPNYRTQVLARAQSAAATSRPFAERLVHFWTNHFAISADKGVVTGIAGTLENEVIRPHVNGNFTNLLLHVERHPAMIAFLDNQASVGPNSRAAQFAGRRADAKRLGINENLAREAMELHTLGVNGGYTQGDVTAFANVLSGWSIGGTRGRFKGGQSGAFYFRENVHEPGPQIILGKRFAEAGQAQGEAVLRHLARQPATAKFIATKLVRHFVCDDPPAAAVERVERAFRHSEGDLPTVYVALMECPECADPTPRKFKTPEELVFSTLRAFAVVPGESDEVLRSFEFLAQRQYTPGSPAGWPDTAKSWDGSDALMHRVLWASRVGAKFERGVGPLDVATSALGAYARPETLTALKRAASAGQALALLVMSPEFQRR
jgi:uncharacterized protein (DUF1800 family)